MDNDIALTPFSISPDCTPEKKTDNTKNKRKIKNKPISRHQTSNPTYFT